MYKLLVFLSFFALLSGPVFSATIVFDTDEDVTFTSLAANTKTLVTEHGSGGGNTEADPSIVYIPINKQGNEQQSNNILGTDLPELANGTVSAGQTLNLTFDIDLDTGDGTQYIYIAYETDDDEYQIIQKFAEVTGDVDGVTYTIDISEICNTTDNLKDCTTIAAANSADITEEDLFYIFTSDSSIALKTKADYPTTNTGGAFLQTNWSNRLFNGTDSSLDVDVALTGIVTGDSSLYISYLPDEAFPDAKEVIIFNFAAAQAEQDYLTATGVGSTINDENEFGVDDNGAQIQVKDLVNNQVYNLGVAFVDKYQFVTNVSATSQGIPLEIAEFLNEQSCYLVSAGFGRPHYVLQYFRMIRDQYLLKTEWGKAFVDFYYSTAPGYAGYVYKNQFLATVVRGASYMLYYTMRYFWLFTLLAFVILYLSRFLLCNRAKKQ